MTVTGADVSSKLKDMLRERGYAVSGVGPRTWEARKKLKRVGLKGRIIYFLTRVVDTLTLKELEDINKLFERRRPKGSMTFFFCNIVLIVDDGYEEGVVKYIADKIFETWNTAPYAPWDVLFTSYTKATHSQRCGRDNAVPLQAAVSAENASPRSGRDHELLNDMVKETLAH